MSQRRRSIDPLGIHDESAADLAAHDEHFFGADDESSSENSSDWASSEGSDQEHAPKRTCYGVSTAASLAVRGEDDDEMWSDSDIETSEVHSIASGGDDAGDQLSAIMEAEVRDLMDIGCGCSGTNHFTTLPRDALVSLMVSIRQMDKQSQKQYVLGELAACINPASADAAAQRRYHYTILGYVVCKSVFEEVHDKSVH